MLLDMQQRVGSALAFINADAPALAGATLRALGDPDLRERLGVAARELYERAFSPPVAARRLVRELEELASSSER